MAIHSSVLAWRILGTGEPGGLLSIGSHRVGHNWSDLAAAAVAAAAKDLKKRKERNDLNYKNKKKIRVNIITNLTEMKMILRDCYEQVHTNKLDN